MKDLKHHLEVALAVKRISGNEFADQLKISPTQLWRVAKGTGTSERVRTAIVEFIIKARTYDPLKDEPEAIAA